MMPKGIFVRTQKHRLANSRGQLGKKMSFEARKKMSDSKKGKKPYQMTAEIRLKIKNSLKGKIPWNKGLKGWNLGHPVSQETRDKIGRANTKLNPKSTLNKLIRKSNKFKVWRKGVFERDDYTCQNCGRRSKRGDRIDYLHPHHIYYLAKIIRDYNLQTRIDAENCDIVWDISNGETLCSTCHQKKHSKIILSLKKAVKL